MPVAVAYYNVIYGTLKFAEHNWNYTSMYIIIGEIQLLNDLVRFRPVWQDTIGCCCFS